MPRLSLFGMLGALVASAPMALAKPPSLTGFFPPGAQRGRTVAVSASGTFDHWPAQVWVSGPGLNVVAEKERGKLSIAVAPDAKPGVRWIRLHDEEGATELRPFVIGLLPEVVEPESSTPLEGALRVTINGRLAKSGQVDAYMVKLQKGQTLVASVDANRILGSPMDAVLQVTSAQGFVLAQNDDDHGMDPQIALEVPEDGVYHVRLFAFPAVPNSTIGFAGGADFVYRLTLTTGGFLDYPYPLAVTRGCATSVQAVGWNLTDETRKVPVVAELDEDLAQMVAPDLANPVEVRLVTHPAPVENEPNDAEHPQAIAIPSSVSGRIDAAKDRDVYEFVAKKGQPITFRLEARVLDSPLDAVLVVTDAAGKTLLEADDTRRNRDPEVNFNPPADGSYRLVVRDLSERGGERYVYGVDAVLSEPDFRLTLGADRFTLEPGKPLTVPVNVLRKHGYKQPIEIHLEGFPAGVEATSVRSEPEGESAAAVKLTLTSKGTPASVPIRVVGKAVDDSHRERTAMLPGPDRLQLPAWLTVAKPAKAGSK